MISNGAVTSALWAHNSYESRKVGFWKCRLLFSKLSAPENAYPDPQSLQILKIIIWIQNSCRSQKWRAISKKLANLEMKIWIRKTCRSWHGKLVYPDTENLLNFHLSSDVAIVPPPTPTPPPGTEQHTVFKYPKANNLWFHQ